MVINIFFSAVSGLLIGLSFYSPNLSFLAWFSLVPFLYAIGKERLKAGLVCAFIFSLCYYGVALCWITQVSKLGFIVLLIYLSLYYLLFLLAARYLFNKPLRIITLSCLWVMVEFLKERVWTGFGWANLGYSQYDNFYIIQSADLLGTKFITFLIVLFNILIWEMVSYFKEEKREVKRKVIFAKVVFVFFIFSSSLFYSLYRTSSLDESGYLEVAVIQPNVPQELKWDERVSSDVIEGLYILGKRTKGDVLTIFPESAWPHTVDEDNFYQLQSFINSIQRDTLIGIISKKDKDFYNSALLFNKQAKLKGYYNKIKLVPFGEYVPLRKYLSFVSIVNYIGDIRKGDDFSRFSYENKDFSVLICFEDIFPLHVARMARGCDFLINITNDAWFGGEPEASQHLGIMTLRAIENRISIVRSANTGISGWASFKGKIHKLERDGQDIFFADSSSFNISLNLKRSFYNKYPEIFVGFCAFFLLGVFLIDRTFAKRKAHGA
jgi:apolipoprotein N-acyltransferase